MRALPGCLLALGACAATSGVTLTESGDRVDARFHGEAFASYRNGGRRPIVWPLCAPGGIPVTRSFPLAEVAGEPQDHPHHESLWFAHGAVAGVDFWQGDGRIVVEQRTVDAATGSVHGAASWRDGKGHELCRDNHTVTFAGGEAWRAVDFDLLLLANHGDLPLGDTKEGTFAVRLRPELCLRGTGAAGRIWNSEGLTGDAAWGKRARWVAYAAAIDGRTVVVAMFDHPQNPSFPTWWHARDYGLLAANPFGVHDFEGRAPGTGDRTVPAGQSLRFRYRVHLAVGEPAAQGIEGAWQQWAARR